MGELPTVCVIGAGVSGLTACKALADFGIPHTCFEASDEVGGNWYFENPNGTSSAYRSLHIDISKPSISFRDFPMPDRYPDYPHHTHIFEWLRDYADAFALRERIRFNTRVQRAERGPAGGWQITLEDGEQQRFDALLVCNGHHWDPRFPDFPGLLRRAGDPLARLHRPEHPTRPLRQARARRRDRQQRRRHRLRARPQDRLGHRLPLDPLRRVRRAEVHLRQARRSGRQDESAGAGRPAAAAAGVLPRIFSGRMEDFGLPTPNHNFLDAHPTVSSELLGRLGAGDAVAKGDVAELLGDRVRFADGSVEPVDAIVYATGYKVSFPFFDPEFLSAPENVLPLYKRMLKPGLDDLAFIGLGQPIPTIFPFSELQSKLAARWLVGDWAPPATSEMEAEIVRDEAFHTGHFINKPRHTMQLEWYAFQHELNTRSIPAGQARARAGAATGLAAAGRGAALEGAELPA